MEKAIAAPKYWKSLEQWRNDPEVQALAAQEFMSTPLASEDGKDGIARRDFLKLMGASLALTTFGCVRKPVEKIVPYSKAPEEVIPGIANFYSSTFVDPAGEGLGVLVKTREGRPIKVEGNPNHPANRGGMSARAHAHVLSLWDPDRLSGPIRNLLNEKKTNRDTISVTWEKVDTDILKALEAGKVALLTDSSTSPSRKNLIQDFKSAFGAQHLVWSAVNHETVVEGQKLSYGEAAMILPRLDRARLIVTIDADILGTYISPTVQTREFALSRKPGKDMNQLVVFESLMSLTGMNADERYRIRPSEQIAVVASLLHELVVKQKRSRYGAQADVAKAIENLKSNAGELKIDSQKFSSLANRLWENRGQSIVVAGGLTAETSAARELQVAVNFLNHVLENDGKTVDYRSLSPETGSIKALTQLAEGLQSGKFETVIIYGTNPVYSAPGDLKIADALRRAKLVVYVSDRNDETGLISDYVLANHHPMETWGDAEIWKGVYSIQQPTLRPLNDTRGFEETLLAWTQKAKAVPARAKAAQTWYDYVRNTWKTLVLAKGDFEASWYDLLQKGVVETSEFKKTSLPPRNFRLEAIKNLKVNKTTSDYELSLYQTVSHADGTLTNVSWLQEFPDPVTKMVWDNYLCVSPGDAKKLKLKAGNRAALKVGETTYELPVHIQPGQADGVLGLAVGYGRKGMGEVADGVGENAFPLARTEQGRVTFAGISAQVEKIGGRYDLACVQDHHSMEGREIVVEATLADYMKDPSANIEKKKVFSIWSEHQFSKHKWGMVIDLNSCTGCGACVIACQSENNVPTVGKKYVLLGREMHWLRIDRYYTGQPEEPGAVFQPVLCQHCDNAPCETVCPVAATVHSDEGTNDMIYNRCVGTRYCSNNCPYKVRRFNWFNNVKTVREPLNYAMNPEVTVRSRGVMEKCTFCIHRIKDEKRQAKVDGRELKDGDVKTACQQSCPAQAIVFGDLNDKQSQVWKEFKGDRSYSLLEELNTKPAVRYQSRIRNSDSLKGAQV